MIPASLGVCRTALLARARTWLCVYHGAEMTSPGAWLRFPRRDYSVKPVSHANAVRLPLWTRWPEGPDAGFREACQTISFFTSLFLKASPGLGFTLGDGTHKQRRRKRTGVITWMDRRLKFLFFFK